jgi:hypothetical protein
MKREEALEKIKEMLPDVTEYLIKESERLLRSGGVDPENFPEGYTLSKVVLTVALENCANQYSPIKKTTYYEDVKNLRYF